MPRCSEYTIKGSRCKSQAMTGWAVCVSHAEGATPIATVGVAKGRRNATVGVANPSPVRVGRFRKARDEYDPTWDDLREPYGDRVLEVISEYAPNIHSIVRERQVLSPLDLERRFGIAGGNIFHGEMSLDQMFFLRPVAGWARYRTPIAGLYLCGSGAHPGGGVMGAPGYNAAREILR